MSERRNPVDVLGEVLDEQYKLFHEAVAAGSIPEILDIAGEITQTCKAILDAHELKLLNQLSNRES